MCSMTPISPCTSGENRPKFDVGVPPGGYRWWYLDGLSADGSCGIVIIAFIGSVFSPYYFRARQRSGGSADPENHCAINVGLYRPRSKLWAMTERSKQSVSRAIDWFEVGPSRMEWRGNTLVATLRERAAPFGQAIAGDVVLRPRFINTTAFSLDAGGAHTWQPMAPSADIDVRLQKPDWQWQGDAYFDTNHGRRALEKDFLRWNWSRSGHAAGGAATRITYDVTPTNGASRGLALAFDATGKLAQKDLPPALNLPKSGWRVARETRSDGSVRVLRTLEDAPFYARSMLQQSGGRAPGLVMHESLALDRFRAAWVRCLLPFRMPRVR